MASYSDMMKDVEQDNFLQRWAPKGSYEHLKPTVDNLRWNIARAHAAEARVKEMEDCLRSLKGLLRGV